VIGFLISFLVLLIVLGCLYWVAQLVISNFAPPPLQSKAMALVTILIVLVFIWWLLSLLGWTGGGTWTAWPPPTARRPC
jgi:hypothetical protein